MGVNILFGAHRVPLPGWRPVDFQFGFVVGGANREGVLCVAGAYAASSLRCIQTRRGLAHQTQ